MTPGSALLVAAILGAGPGGGPMRHERAPRSVVELRPTLVIAGGYYGGAFTNVAGVHCDRRTGEVFVVDSTLNQVEIFDSRGAPLFSFTDDEHLKGPLRVATDAEDRIYVLDQERSRIKVYSYRGEFQAYLEPPGLGGEEKPILTAMAFDEGGDLWVGDSRSGQVVAYGRGLQPKQRIGTLGQGPGQLDGIVGIALDDQHVYVASQEGIAIHVFTRQGKFLRAWGHHDAGLHNVSLPAGIAVDAKGRVILLDTLRQELKYFDGEGRLIELFGGLGRHAGALAYPTDLSMDRTGQLCVADGGNRRAQVLQPIEATPLDDDASPSP